MRDPVARSPDAIRDVLSYASALLVKAASHCSRGAPLIAKTFAFAK